MGADTSAPAPVEIDRLRDLARAGYELSTYVACINWDGHRNRGEWLEGLHEDINKLQSAAIAAGIAPASGVSICDKHIVRAIAKAKAHDAAEEARESRGRE